MYSHARASKARVSACVDNCGYAIKRIRAIVSVCDVTSLTIGVGTHLFQSLRKSSHFLLVFHAEFLHLRGSDVRRVRINLIPREQTLFCAKLYISKGEN